MNGLITKLRWCAKCEYENDVEIIGQWMFCKHACTRVNTRTCEPFFSSLLQERDEARSLIKKLCVAAANNNTAEIIATTFQMNEAQRNW
jgi:hypothetical protein